MPTGQEVVMITVDKINLGRLRNSIESYMEEYLKVEDPHPHGDCVEYQIEEISSGAMGCHQPTQVMRWFDLDAKDLGAEVEPDIDYDPDDDEYFWESAEKKACDFADDLEKAIVDKCQPLPLPPEKWSLCFCHFDADCSYGLSLIIHAD
jgi:hypothetical protein